MFVKLKGVYVERESLTTPPLEEFVINTQEVLRVRRETDVRTVLRFRNGDEAKVDLPLDQVLQALQAAHSA